MSDLLPPISCSSYLPGQSLGADVLRLARHLSPEGSDSFLVLSCETGHLAFLTECRAEPKPRGFLYLKQSSVTPGTSSKRLQEAGSSGGSQFV